MTDAATVSNLFLQVCHCHPSYHWIYCSFSSSLTHLWMQNYLAFAFVSASETKMPTPQMLQLHCCYYCFYWLQQTPNDLDMLL
jgi:hypothetical protein